jgi:hypothetical protein
MKDEPMSDEFVLKPYEVEITVDAARDEVWDAVTYPPSLRQWFGWDYDGLDAEIQHIFVAEAVQPAPGRMRWADGSYLEVVGDEARTTVRAVREGPAPRDPEAYDAIEEGWRAFLIQLRFWLARRPKGARRTIYLTGGSTGRQALALVDGDWTHEGPRTAWTTDADGSLIVVASQGRLPDPRPSRKEITVSTYGLEKGAFEACRESWAERWTPIAAGAAVTVAGQPAPH